MSRVNPGHSIVVPVNLSRYQRTVLSFWASTQRFRSGS